MVNIKISSQELIYLHKWSNELAKSCDFSCCQKESVENACDVIEKAYHSISQGHTEHEISFSDGAVKFLHDGLLDYQKEHKDHMSKEHKDMLASLIEVFNH